jgi:hypothetical protein
MSFDASPATRLSPTFVVIFVAFGAAGQSASGQAPDRPAAKENDQLARLAEMKQIADSFQAIVFDGGTRTPAARVPEPLYRWNDPTREFSDGTLWFWKHSGRPIGVVAIELYPKNKAFGIVWALEFTSLATGPIEVEGGEHFDLSYADLYPPRADGRLRWAPAQGGIAFREVSGAPVPAQTESARSRQMRDIVARFSAREFFQRKDYTLRLISHPIDRYADITSGVVDGEIFIYANGTNPEVLLMLEARRGREGAMSWSYAAAPLARAVVTLRLDQQDVWSHTSKAVPSPEDVYFLARKPRRLPAPPARGSGDRSKP